MTNIIKSNSNRVSRELIHRNNLPFNNAMFNLSKNVSLGEYIMNRISIFDNWNDETASSDFFKESIQEI